MSEKYNTNINSIEEAIKQLEDLKEDRLSFVTGDKEHDNIFLKDVQSIEIVLGNLEALCDMQKSANRELKNSIPKKKIKDIMKKLNNEYKKIDDSIDIYSNSDDRGKVDCLQMISWFEGELEELLQESEE